MTSILQPLQPYWQKKLIPLLIFFKKTIMHSIFFLFSTN
jgi:hypothetical protein